MSLPSSMYTPAGGSTPQGQQTAAGQPNATNTQPPPSLNSSPEQLSGALGNASTQLASMQTPASRQGYIDNSNLPAMQSNYNDLATQLAAYDKAVLQPQFAGQAPQTPTGTIGGTDVPNSPLMFNTSPNQTPEQMIYNPNPGFALAAQTTQGNNIADLLNVLNSGIGKEFGQRSGQYNSTVQSQKDLVKTITDLMGQQSDLALRKAEMDQRRELQMLSESNSRNIAAANNANSRVVEGIRLGVIDPSTGLPWEGTDSSSDGTGTKDSPSGTPQSYADSFMGGYTKWSDIPDQLKPAVSSIVKKQGGSIQKITDSYNALDNTSSIINQIFDKWTGMSEFEKHIPGQLVSIIPGLSATRSGINSTFTNNLEPELRKAVAGGRITQQEYQWIKNSIIPTAADSYESALAKMQAVRDGLNLKRTNPQYSIGSNTSVGNSSGTIRVKNNATGQTGTIPAQNFNPSKYTKL